MVTSDLPSERPQVSVWVKLFVLFHVFAITVWSFPTPPTGVDEGKVKPKGTQWLLYWNKKYLKPLPVVTVYLTTTGFWQYWDMFAPNPAGTDYWADAIVRFNDGTTKHYQYPRMALLSIPLKLEKERFRKFFERAGDDDNTFLWTAFAKRIAYLHDSPVNPPVEVKLFRHWRPVAPPGRHQNPDYSSYMYYDYVVHPEDLSHLKRVIG